MRIIKAASHHAGKIRKLEKIRATLKAYPDPVLKKMEALKELLLTKATPGGRWTGAIRVTIDNERFLISSRGGTIDDSLSMVWRKLDSRKSHHD